MTFESVIRLLPLRVHPFLLARPGEQPGLFRVSDGEVTRAGKETGAAGLGSSMIYEGDGDLNPCRCIFLPVHFVRVLPCPRNDGEESFPRAASRLGRAALSISIVSYRGNIYIFLSSCSTPRA